MKRISNLFWSFVCLGFFTYLTYFQWQTIEPIWALSKNSQQTTGKVISYEFSTEKISRRKRISHNYHTISYLKHEQTFDLDYRIPIGKVVPIVYAPTDLDNALITDKTTFFAMVWDTQGWFGSILMPFLIFAFGFGFLSYFKDFIKPPADE